MRVLLATSLDAGGPLEHALILARHLSGAGVEVTATCATPAVAERFAATGATPVELPLRGPGDARGGAALARLGRRHDVLHAQDRRTGLWSRIWPRRDGDPARVYTVHGLPDPFLPLPQNRGRRPGVRANLAYRGLDSWLARRSDAIVVPSHALAEILVRRLRFPTANLAVIPNGVEVDDAPAGGDAAAGGELVGTVSLLGPVKGVDTFLAAAAAVGHRRPGQRFVVVGDGPERGALEALAKRLDAPVEFTGTVPMAEVVGRFRVFVLPSLFENCPLSLMEAMAAGVPAIASAVGGVPELVGDAGVTVPPSDPAALEAALEALLDDPAGAADLGRRGRERIARDFSAARNAEALLDLYERVARR
jgi:glycosyltransferase involved in cell wall biosynthesis